MRATHRRCCTRGVCRRRQTDTKTPAPGALTQRGTRAPTRTPSVHPPTHTTRARTHAPTMCAHNTSTPALPTHPPTMHLLASSHVDVTHGIRHRVRGRCARHTRTFHTSHTDSENGPRAEALISAATPPGRMDTSSMTAHKAWSHFVDAAMMRWFSSRAPPKIDRGSHDMLCVREAWHGGRIPLASTSTMRNGGWIHVRGLFLRCVVEKSL